MIDFCFCIYQMIHHLVSTNPDDYGTIRFKSSVASLNSIVAYRISSLSTIASFSMTTPDDYMIIETTINNEPVELTLHFEEHGAFEQRELIYYLNTLFEGQLVSLEDEPPIVFTILMDSTYRLIIGADKEFNIIDASYRVKLLFGLYHSSLPLSSIQKQIKCPSVPMLSYADVLYLTSKTDFVSVVNIDNREETRSICYKVNEIIYPGVPISCKLPGSWSMIHTDSLGSLEFRLVDFNLQPIILHSPLFITIEIQNLNSMNQSEERTNLIEIL